MTEKTYTSSILAELQWRGLIHQITHEDLLDNSLKDGAMTLYIGFDPTATSLHVGSLVPIMTMAYFRRHGHNPIAVAGGATGMIGDPSGKSDERNLQSQEVLDQNLAGLSTQLRALLGNALTLHPQEMESHADTADTIAVLNNGDWITPWSLLDFLRDVGKHFSVNQMIKKDSVRLRMESEDAGLSFTEFSYMLIQAYDFYHLYKEHGCRLQAGGSDQWGNITAGTELIRRKACGKEQDTAFGLTFPLLLKSDGTKFGKSQSGNVWLDAHRTSPYQFYQFWINQPDADVPMLLRKFTFLSKHRIDELLESGNPRLLQSTLAYEVTSFVHGADQADRAVRASRMLFKEKVTDLDDASLREIFADVPSSQFERARFEGEGVLLIDLLVETGLQPSKGAARRLVQQNGASINNVKITGGIDTRVTVADLASESMLVLLSGKKARHVVELKAT